MSFFQPVYSKTRPSLAALFAPLLLMLGALGAISGFARPQDSANETVHFPVKHYAIYGNTLLSYKTLNQVFSKHVGTNITFDDIATAQKELQLEYHNRGYDTIRVVIPPQRLTNGIFKIRILEGKLTQIKVTGNRFFSDKNVLRSMRGLKTNVFLNSKLFQQQLDLANANSDRQIYPEIEPGSASNTTTLVLRVKDQLPLHAKIEANNESTPGTPEQRLAASAAYNNLWQLEHSIGVQYTISEQEYKQAPGWSWYDRPLMANYSGFYRLPLSPASSPTEDAAANPTKFGYNEATRKFVLPQATGATELNVYASGSTIDSGVTSTTPTVLNVTNGSSLTRQTIHQDLTLNNAIGWRLSQPVADFYGIHPHLEAGTDYKTYEELNFETNEFTYTYFLVNTLGQSYTTNLTTKSTVPGGKHFIAYMPLTLHADADRDDKFGTTSLTLNFSPDLLFSGGRSNVQAIAGSPKATGHWHIITGSLSRDQTLVKDWRVALRVDGQWSDQPLIANEQFGGGGISGVRGYHEGEIYGDEGWRVTSELKAPPFRIGYAGSGTSTPLTVRASIFMDYTDTYLLDPQGRKPENPLWGTGIAGAASLGTHFNSMLSLGWPLLSTPTTEAYQLRVAFSLSAQF